MNSKIKLILDTLAGREIEILAVYKHPGDASDRSYYRYLYKADNEVKTSMMMKLKDKFDRETLPFINVHAHLKSSGLRVPEIYGIDGGMGFIVLEDLGDATMEMRLGSSENSEIKNLYEKAIDLLIDMQIKASPPKTQNCIAFTLEFDIEKFMFEFNFFKKHYLEGLLKSKITIADAEALNNEFTNLSEILASEPKVFTHRDYHSRNLMVLNGDLAMLDFQDARMGLCQYDLASLLRDSYIVLEDSLRDNLIEYYICKNDAYKGIRTDKDEFRRLFDLTSVQRNIKAIGTFAYQKVVRGNDFYLKYIPDTLRYVKENLEKYEELKGLKTVFGKYIRFSRMG